MKKLFLLALVPMFMLSCGLRAKKIVEEKELALTDSIQIVEGLGPMVEDIFQGVVPAADGPGIDITLTIYHQEYAESGVYRTKETYIEGEDGKDITVETTGEWHTRQTESHPIYILKDFDGNTVQSYVYKGDVVELLDENMDPIVSENNYTLKRVMEHKKVKP